MPTALHEPVTAARPSGSVAGGPAAAVLVQVRWPDGRAESFDALPADDPERGDRMESLLALVTGDANATQQNFYLREYGGDRLRLSMLASLKQAASLPPRALYWLTPSDARDATRLTGFAVSGAADNLVLRWDSGNFERGSFAHDGGQ